MRPGQPGGPTRAEVRGKRWRRVSRGLYVPADVSYTTSQRIVEAAARLPSYAALGGWAAAYWMGVRFLDGMRGRTPLPVPLNIADGTGHIRPVQGAMLMRTRMVDSDISSSRGINVTIPVRIAYDGARLAGSLAEAVIFLDMMFAAGLTTPGEVAAYTAEHRPAWKGVEQVRRALALSDSGSRSPQETRLRLLWVTQTAIPRPRVNEAVYGPGGELLGIPDLLDTESGLVAEYDGGQHRDLQQHAADNLREERMEHAGLVVVRFTALDMRRPALVVDRLHAGWRRGLARDRDRDRWSLTPPDGSSR